MSLLHNAKRRRHIALIGILVLPAAVCGLVAYGLTFMSYPAAIEAELAVGRLQFELAGDKRAPILAPLQFRELSASGFQNVRFHVARVSAADPSRFDMETGSYEDSAWTPLDKTGEMNFVAGSPELHPAMSIEAWSDLSGPIGKLPSIYTEPGNVITLEVDSDNTLVVTIGQSELELDVRVEDSVQLFTRECVLEPRWLGSFDLAPTAYRMSLADHRPALHLMGSPSGTSLSIVLAPQETEDLLSAGNLLARDLKFLVPQADRLASSVIGDGRLRYRDYPSFDDIEIGDSDLVLFEDTQSFWIKSLRMLRTSTMPGLHVVLEGETRRFSVGAGEPFRTFRVSVLDALFRDPMVGSLSAMVLWVFSATLAGFKLYGEMTAKSDSQDKS